MSRRRKTRNVREREAERWVRRWGPTRLVWLPSGTVNRAVARTNRRWRAKGWQTPWL